jgi:hypothetical protein
MKKENKLEFLKLLSFWQVSSLFLLS